MPDTDGVSDIVVTKQLNEIELWISRNNGVIEIICHQQNAVGGIEKYQVISQQPLHLEASERIASRPSTSRERLRTRLYQFLFTPPSTLPSREDAETLRAKSYDLANITRLSLTLFRAFKPLA